MNPEAIALITAYKSGQLPVDRFLLGMNRLGFSDQAATAALVDFEVQQTQARRQQEATGTTAAPAAPSATPPASTPPQAPSAPYYGSDDIPVGSATNPVAPTAAPDQPYYHSERAENSYYGRRQPDVPGDAQRFRPMPDAAQQAVSVAKSIPQREVSSTQTTEGPSALASFIRGRFGEAAKGSPYDDRLTAFQEARDRSGDSRATGGEVNGKAPLNKDAALHKALEIIQHLLSRG